MIPDLAGEGALLNLVTVLGGDSELLVQFLPDVLDIDRRRCYHDL